jgi:hypothetical protein
VFKRAVKSLQVLVGELGRRLHAAGPLRGSIGLVAALLIAMLTLQAVTLTAVLLK